MKEQLQRMLEQSLYRRKLAVANYERARARMKIADEETATVIELLKAEKRNEANA